MPKINRYLLNLYQLKMHKLNNKPGTLVSFASHALPCLDDYDISICNTWSHMHNVNRCNEVVMYH